MISCWAQASLDLSVKGKTKQEKTTLFSNHNGSLLKAAAWSYLSAKCRPWTLISKGYKKRNLQFLNHENYKTMCFSFFLLHTNASCAAGVWGLPWVSAVDDLMSVRKALAAGLFFNAAQYVSTTVESRDKEHTRVDIYHLVRSTGHGQSHISLISFDFKPYSLG